MQRTTISLTVCLTLCLVLAGCGDGDFCDVWQGPKSFHPDTAKQIVKTDRPDAEGIKVENDYGAANCHEKGPP
ncbi:putative small lipoprotein YifL [Sagittula marina]|uniref:Putative small lipoprotein YifL n=1 Tax=Sagittula marina TaxID=943940 RepID=A0A7W6DT13_9RHOB|nr:hypothetical protein [Sagittula marina]MBB3986190.1 putative small lipoprotein YifL [Sagittula marina]